jgi:gliding motility-associated-like protein
MRKNLLPLCGLISAFFFLVVPASVNGQTPQLTLDQYTNAKAHHELDGKAPATFLTNDSLGIVARIAPNIPVNPATSSCSCWQNRDASFSVVPFSGYIPPDYRNDDGFTNVISIPFNFCLYGQTWNSLYINNNGNVSFGAPYSTFTATGFPNASFEMVAPFWGDVQTDNPASGLVYYKITPTYMIVQWDSVGYYFDHADLRNTFQLIITDGSDPIVPNGNVSFCYKDMQWTTGDASGGVGGFGGSDAIVGANRGDGVNYIQFGSFNQPGGTYNGPQAANSGIDWLDNQSFTFDACTNSNNIPPTPAGLSSCDTLRICQGDSLPLNVQFFSPEVGQTTTITVNSTGVNGYTIISNTPGNTAQLISYLIGQANNVGYNTITVTATDNGTPNATTVITTVILVTASPTATSTSTNSLCSSNTGTATVTASGGSGSYTYAWTPSGGTAATATGLGPGTYTCTITDAVTGCSTRQTVVIGGGGTVTATSSQNNVTCNGANDGSATVVASGGTPGYTYAWSPSGGSAATATGLSGGTYSCTITDANGCVNTQTFNIIEPAVLTVSSTQTNVLCNGGNNGSATVTASGGTTNYAYAWNPGGATTATASGLTAQCYTCTVTDAHGCTTSTSVCITEPTVLTCSITVANTPCSGASATANPTGGSGPYSYAWSNFSFTQTISNLSTGNYSVTITDMNGCTTTQSVAIVSSPVLSATSTWTSVFCFGDSTGTASVTAIGGTPSYTYAWTPYGGSSSSASGLGAGSYTCTITDANGCTTTRMFTLTQPSQVVTTTSQTDNGCFGDQNGTATVSSSGGVPGYTYSWAPIGGSGSTASGLGNGTYTCTITDSNGCNSTASVTITSPTALTCSVSVVNASCSVPGSATAFPSGGTTPYTYSWSSGGTAATENNLPAGTYTVTITDPNGCTTTQTATITTSSPISASSVSSNITCFGSLNGSATVTPAGGTSPYTYSWSPSGGNNATASGLGVGTYTCTITDANGCTTTQSVSITQPSQLTSTSSQTNVLCNGGTTGTATVNAGGGTPGYTYAWSPSGGSAATATGLGAGTYTCTITDANGCTHTQSFTITQPAALLANVPDIAVCDSFPGTIAANASGGTGPYTYSWSNGPTTSSQVVYLETTTDFTCTITDANGCTTSGVSQVTVNPIPQVTITTNSNNGIFVVDPSMQLCFDASGNGVVSWLWTFPSDTSSLQAPCVNITASDTGTFCGTLVFANAAGCLNVATSCVEVTNESYSIPNVFSPNADGTNDVFIITNTGMETLHCVIYNRWGEVVYEWNSPTGSWDGKTKNGNEAVDGVYYWTVDMMDYSGKAYADHGFVQLIRGPK